MAIRERLLQIANDLPEGLVNSFQVTKSTNTITKLENYTEGTEGAVVNISLELGR